MAKTKKILLIIVFAVLLLSTVFVSYAAYTSSATSSGSVKAKSFNTSNTMQQNIPIDIWLGETKYYYFEIENKDATGKVSGVDISVIISVRLKAFENKPYKGLRLTVEEYSELGSMYNDKYWESITGKVIITTEGVIEGKSSKIFLANTPTTRRFRIKYDLPDNVENAQANGFYTAGDISLLNVKSAVDIQVKVNQNI